MLRALLLTVLLATALRAYPCTTFCMTGDGQALFGRNYDFEIGQGYVMTNSRGVVKTSMAGTLRWTSRYGSVTFNQWGRELPMDGMNEAGLVIALMWLDETVYPRDERPSLRVLEWIQYGLDIYDARRKEVSWVSDRNRQRKTVRMEGLSFDCIAGGKMLDVHAGIGGEVTSLLDPYDPQRNRDLVLSSYATTSFTRNEPVTDAVQDAAHAESFSCAGPRRRTIRK